VKLVFEKVEAFEASDVAALTGTKAKAPEYEFEFGTAIAFDFVVRADATSVCVDRSSTISKVRYCELKTLGNIAETSSTLLML
jgi:hypothetical protein